MNDKLIILKDMGLIENWVRETMMNASNCDTIANVVASHQRSSISLGLSQIGSFFILVIGGLILSLFGFLAEAAWNRCRSTKLLWLGYQ